MISLMLTISENISRPTNDSPELVIELSCFKGSQASGNSAKALSFTKGNSTRITLVLNYSLLDDQVFRI